LTSLALEVLIMNKRFLLQLLVILLVVFALGVASQGAEWPTVP
jgi:hypothetical protein